MPDGSSRSSSWRWHGRPRILRLGGDGSRRLLRRDTSVVLLRRGWRRFTSPAEEMERLQDYLEELKKEMAGVEARIRELKGKK